MSKDNFFSSTSKENNSSNEPLVLIVPLNFSKVKANELEYSQFEIYQASMNSGLKIASAKEHLKNLDRGYRKHFMEQKNSLQNDILDENAFLNSNLLNIIAATDRNEDTLGHSQLVARYSLLLAKSFEIEDKEILSSIEKGALLHDIGKIGIPEAILRKPGALTPVEMEIIKEHPLLGYGMIEEFDFFKKASRIVLYHHEQFNGSGYPYGLKGEEIPLEARIFALADTLDAITSDRPYRKRSSFENALEEIEKSKGTQFDPFLIENLLSIPMEDFYQIKREHYRFSYTELTH